MSFPPRFLDELRERISIGEVVARRVKLQRRGREQTGLCPFHNEKTPSFTVSDEKGFYHCFGCGAHGDAISFVMQTEGLAFPEAVEKLAAEAGLAVPRQSPEEAARERRSADLHQALEAACGFFETQLRMREGRAALDYLRSRGLEPATIARFRLGFAPERRGALAAGLAREGVTPERLVEAGLLKRAEGRDDVYEYFRGRVVFPITDRRGRVIGFGGRALGDAQPKYLNSPDTPVFAKGRVLYNLAQAREAARIAGTVIVVEGYMDVIALDRAGLGHAVAPLGTALTEEQMRELWRLAPEPVLCFDGDTAGQRAAARAAERALPLLAPGRSLRFAGLPPGEDPDSIVRTRGADAVRSVIEASRPLADVLWQAETARTPLDTPERRASLHQRLRELAHRIGDRTVRDYYLNDFRTRLAQLFGHRDGPWRGPGRRPGPVPAADPGRAARLRIMRNPREAELRRTQLHVLGTLIEHPSLIPEFEEFLADLDLPAGELDRLRLEILNVSTAVRELDADILVSHLTRAGFAATLGPILSRRVDGGAWRRFADVEQARISLEHIATRWQRKLIEHHVRAEIDQLDETATDQKLESIVAVAALERSRISGGDS